MWGNLIEKRWTCYVGESYCERMCVGNLIAKGRVMWGNLIAKGCGGILLQRDVWGNLIVKGMCVGESYSKGTCYVGESYCERMCGGILL